MADVCPYRVCEEQASAAADQPPSTLGTAVNAPTPDEDIFVAVEFSLALPPGFRETEVLPPKPVETRPGFGSFGMQFSHSSLSQVLMYLPFVQAGIISRCKLLPMHTLQHSTSVSSLQI